MSGTLGSLAHGFGAVSQITNPHWHYGQTNTGGCYAPSTIAQNFPPLDPVTETANTFGISASLVRKFCIAIAHAQNELEWEQGVDAEGARD